MSGDARLDVVLVRRGLARSRRQAHDLVGSGRVVVDGRTATKPGRPTPDRAPIEVRGEVPEYVSRAGHKLAGALGTFAPGGLRVAGRRALDAGASTGGFTEVLLRAGAREVLAVDVGHGQLVPALRDDPAVRVYERTNVRDLDADALGGPVDVVAADLSFISLTLVLPALARCTYTHGDLVLLVKPQFEVGREAVGDAGVVRSGALRAQAVLKVADAAGQAGLGVAGLARSQLPGTRGNVEYLLWLRAGDYPLTPAQIRNLVAGEV